MKFELIINLIFKDTRILRLHYNAGLLGHFLMVETTLVRKKIYNKSSVLLGVISLNAIFCNIGSIWVS